MQFALPLIDPEVTTGTDLAGYLNGWRPAVESLHSGAARPTYAGEGMLWLDKSGGAANWALKLYDGADDITIARIDSTANTIIGGAGSFTSVTSSGLITGNAGVRVPNGQYFQAARSSAGTVINVLGFDAGSDVLTLRSSLAAGNLAFRMVDTGAFVPLSVYGGGSGGLLMGTWPVSSAYSFLQHSALPVAAGNYALLVSAIGDSFLNAPTGRNVGISINNAGIVSVGATGVAVTGVLNASGSSQIGGNFQVLGDSSIFGSLSTDTSKVLIVGISTAIRMGTSSTGASIEGVDQTGSASYKPLHVNGSLLELQIAGTPKLSINAAGNVSIPGALAVTGAGTFTGGVLTPSLGIGSDSRIPVQINGVSKWLFGNSGDGFAFAPNADNTYDIGLAGVVRVRNVYAVNFVGALVGTHAPSFESAEQNIPAANAQLAVAHGLGRVPKQMRVVMRVKVAQNGFAVGDEVDLTSINDGVRGTYNTWCDAANVGYIGSGNINMLGRPSGGLIGFTAGGANGKLVFYAW